MINQMRKCWGAACLIIVVALVAAPAAFAQYQYPRNSGIEPDRYKNYPQIRGKTESLTEHELPSWMTLDGEIRFRTEDQTAINYLSGQGHFYELERIRGGMELRPT